jgi:hypothetical protein
VTFITGASDTVTAVELGAIGSLIASAITYVVVVIFRFRLPTISHLIFWRRFSRDLIVLISEMPHQYDPTVRRGEQPPLTPLGDAIALADFLRFFKRRLRTDPIVVSAQSQEAFDRVKHHNLLVIGGPKYNFGAQALLADLDERLPYQFRRLRPRVEAPFQADDPEMKRFVGRTSDAPAFTSDPTKDRDYGCVVMTTNPYNEQRRILLVAGLSTLTTIAGSAWLQKTHPRLWLRSRANGFQAIVSCRNSGITRVSHVEPAFVADLSPEVQ